MTEVIVGLLVISLFSVPILMMGLFLLYASAQASVGSQSDGFVEASYQPMVILTARRKAPVKSHQPPPIETRAA